MLFFLLLPDAAMAFLAPAIRWPDALTSHLPQPLRDSGIAPQILVAVPATLVAVVIAYAITRASQQSAGAHLVTSATSDANVLKRAIGRSPTVLLVGLPDSGKTSLFSRLVYQTTPPTLPSQKLSTGTVEADALTSDARGIKPVTLLDLPGHPRLRPLLEEQIHQADGIVICIDALMASKANLGPSTTRPHADQTVTDAADLLHSTLTTLAKARARLSNNIAPPSVLVLFTRADLSPLLGSSGGAAPDASKDEKRRSQLLTRCRTTLENELGQRRSNMGLNRGPAAKGSVKIAGLGKVADADPSSLTPSSSPGGVFGWIKRALGVRSGSSSSTARHDDNEDDEDDHEQVTDYIDWQAAQRAADPNAAPSANGVSAAGSTFSLSKLDDEVVQDGKVEFALSTLGKQRGWHLDSTDTTSTDGTHDLKSWLVQLQT